MKIEIIDSPRQTREDLIDEIRYLTKQNDELRDEIEKLSSSRLNSLEYKINSNREHINKFKDLIAVFKRTGIYFNIINEELCINHNGFYTKFQDSEISDITLEHFLENLELKYEQEIKDILEGNF